MAEDPPECRIRPLREAQGLSQAELGRQAGSSRQLVNLIERGKVTPSVLVALRLAEALGCSVAELFPHARTEISLSATLAEGACGPGPVRVGRIGSRWVSVPVSATETAGFGEADGEMISWSENSARIQPWASESSLRENLFIAGCDPALGIVRDLWRTRDHSGTICWRNLASSVAVDALRRGEVHVAGVHFPPSRAGREALAALPRGLVRIRFAAWEQGWMVRAGNPGGFRSVGDLVSERFRFLNRVAGAGSRMLLDRLLEQARIPARAVPGYTQFAATHQQCASAVAEGRADVAIGLGAVAGQLGLEFLPIEQVAFDLLVSRAMLRCPPVQRLLDLLQQGSFRRQLKGLPGYETRETGQEVELAPPAQKRKP